jgi:formylglycine-generating enzyme required for sulfatase activity
MKKELSVLFLVPVFLFAACGETPEKKSTAKAIASFGITDPVTLAGNINETEKTITVPAARELDLTAMKARVRHTGVSITPNPETAHDYTNPVVFTVTAEDGSSAAYTVTAAYPPIVEIDITPPTKRNYHKGDELDLIGMVIYGIDEEDGLTEIPLDECTVSPDTIPADAAAGALTITVTHNASDIFGAFTVTVTGEFAGIDKKTYTVGTVSFNMNRVPAGRFSRDGGDNNISVITTAYRIGETEVTLEWYDAVMGMVKNDQGEWTADASYTAKAADATKLNATGSVTFYQAIAFCNKLSLRLGKAPVYTVTAGGGPVDFAALAFSAIPTTANTDWNGVVWNDNADGFRLPTEMEFLWAMMGADYVNPGLLVKPAPADTWAGKELGLAEKDCAIYSGNGTGGDVKQKAANALGLYDMNGNKAELVWDREAAWPTGTLTDYRGSDSSGKRITKGGSNNHTLANIKTLTFVPAANTPPATSGGMGLRVACALEMGN